MNKKEIKQELLKASEELVELDGKKSMLMLELYKMPDHTPTSEQEAELERLVKRYGELNQIIVTLNDKLDFDDQADELAIAESLHQEEILQEVLDEIRQTREHNTPNHDLSR